MDCPQTIDHPGARGYAVFLCQCIPVHKVADVHFNMLLDVAMAEHEPKVTISDSAGNAQEMLGVRSVGVITLVVMTLFVVISVPYDHYSGA